MPERWIGVDGCRAGWVVARIRKNGTLSVDVYPSIDAIWQQFGSDHGVLIDIPIGFAADEFGTRACDQLARDVLGGQRASSVFPCPTRQALQADTYAEACDANERLTGKRLSRQAWGIAPKILEVDTFLRANERARGRIREVHPEVLFWAMNGSRPMQHRKARRAGVEERLFVLERFVPDIRHVYHHAVGRHSQKEVAPDDILDALAAAVTGHLAGDALQTIPGNPPLDEHGLATEMVVWMPEEPSGAAVPDEYDLAGLPPYVRSALLFELRELFGGRVHEIYLMTSDPESGAARTDELAVLIVVDEIDDIHVEHRRLARTAVEFEDAFHCYLVPIIASADEVSDMGSQRVHEIRRDGWLAYKREASSPGNATARSGE